MQIFFDYQTFSLQNFGGISRYYTELISSINNTNDNQAYLSLLFSNNLHLKEAGLKVNGFFPNNNLYKKTQIICRLNQLYSLHQLKQKKFDVFHATYYDPYFIPYLKGRPFVVTFLDMIHEKFVAQFPGLDDGGVITRQKQFLADRADQIIAISESTKRDVVELLNVEPSKVKVVYLGNSLEPTRPQIDSIQNLHPYLLFVGRRERYKNFEGLLRAAYPLLKKYNIKLLCAGGDPFSQEESLLIDSLGVSDFVEQLSINDEILRRLYQQAIAFIFPTLYEGFGIPVLEAFACDCPCIVSDLSSLPEVAGDAALYIDPTSSESINNAIEQVLNDSGLRQELISKGRERLTHFSWQRTAAETIKVYKTIQ